MAIIPGTAKVLNQYENVNTTYGGSKAMKAQSKWYTMDDVLETVEANIPGGGISGSGITNYVPKFTDSEEVGDSQIFDDGANVGIGTDSPSQRLHVEGGFFAGDGTGNSPYMAITTTSATITAPGTSIITSGLVLTDGSGEISLNPGGDTIGVKFSNDNGVWFNNINNAKFGLVRNDSSLFSENLVGGQGSPSDGSNVANWIGIFDESSGNTYYLPVYI
mgnify:CR=1 FL=1